MPLPEETAAELEGMRRRLLEMLVPLQGDEDSQNLDEQVLRQSLWSAARALESLLGQEHEPVGLDLHQDDEDTRLILCDFVRWDYFTPRALEDTGDVTVPRYTPEECGLRVYFEHGRWFVTWLLRNEVAGFLKSVVYAQALLGLSDVAWQRPRGSSSPAHDPARRGRRNRAKRSR